MDKMYAPQAIEQHWYQLWEERGYFAPAGRGAPYCIMIPPPNVTGSLHMGHAFQNTIMDTLIRYHRMDGQNVLWQVGTDHAGIATQMVVERQLIAQGINRRELGRQPFIQAVWKWKAESGHTIVRQLRRLGASADWSRERFTLDERLSHAVGEVFVRLYEEGLIYRGKRLVNWDPVLRTAVSDLEVVSEEESGQIWYLRYPLADEPAHLVVATTRPETMLGDTAVAVHPHDKRYQHLIGQSVLLPLAQRRIPVIADHYVDPDFGTGCVKITPAHDFNDYQVGQRHHLPLINILTPDAHLNDAVPEPYRGLDRFEARKQVVADLDQLGLLARVQDHKLMVPRGDRSGAVIEPFLTDQWYVNMASLAQPAIQAVENGTVRFIPENWGNTYFEWMRNIQDWCISRQIWWGHRIPAWYDGEGHLYVARNLSEAQAQAKARWGREVTLVQDEDVLDTWFSSALWPFSTLGWPNDTAELQTFYPTQVLITGFDIIFFWVARMIMMGLKFTDQVPFHEVYIHGLVRDAEGQKMSKSKGNILDPIDVIDGIDLNTLVQKRTSGLMQPQMAARIEKATREQFPDGIPAYGTDALRFTFASLATTGRDIRFDLDRVAGYRNFCNKIWNASRYVLMNTESHDTGVNGGERVLGLPERWVWSCLQTVIQEVRSHCNAYRFDLMTQTIYEFVWGVFCDWYVELSKPALAAPHKTASEHRGTRHTLVSVLETLLRLCHPVLPFITEEIWQRIAPLAGKPGATIMLQPYPVFNEAMLDQQAVTEMTWLMECILAVRKIRGEMNVPPRKPLSLIVQNHTEEERRRIHATWTYASFLNTLDAVTFLPPDKTPPESATALVGEMKILIPLAGLIDKDAELARLTKETVKLKNEILRLEKKLTNPDFIARAPSEIVTKEKQRMEDLHSALRKFEEQQQRILLSRT